MCLCGGDSLPGSGNAVYIQPCCCCRSDLASITDQPDTGALGIFCLFLPSPPRTVGWSGGGGQHLSFSLCLAQTQGARTHIHAHTYTHTRKYTSPPQDTVTVICSSSPLPALFPRRWAAAFQGSAALVWLGGPAGWCLIMSWRNVLLFKAFSHEDYVSS